MKTSHTHELLATKRGYRVLICDCCDIVHVEVGPVTLRLRPGALAHLAEVLDHASRQLQTRESNLGTAELDGEPTGLVN
ncbi:hypothetical protein DB30_05702 [Enhygromyxa salina]|uniref:Uncharacterized protein n=1 Tax=Enhygromyxa salina TaxID=215803 RepID=A0A0C2D0J8_9BACT|nr:hypothetical protein [Enhygromyxa salina]KIG15370.1 hypothetical protein DB30_05702 [Enhygromyxa salina]